MFSRRSIVSMMLVCGAVSAQAATTRDAMSVVSIRVHDYALIEGRQLQQAERQVSDTYARIGVRLDWRGVVRPADVEAGKATWPTDVTTLTVVVLTAEMAERLNAPENVAGYAPINRERGGRVAFVFGDRARAIALAGGVEQSNVLAGVIAHELAHLLMPERSHSADGVMRADWNPGEFRRFHRQRFSDAEAVSIRQMVRMMGGSPSRVAD
jgi:Zn-dependent protease with chaperone function